MKLRALLRKPLLIGFLFVISLTFIFIFSNFSSANNSSQESKINIPKSKIDSAEIISYTNPTDSLPDSLAKIENLLIAHKSDYRMSLYAKGKLIKTYIIALGQEPIGPKLQQGDNKTPEGTYKIIQKSRGPFEGDYSQYLGVAWMRINYPNNADAENGFKKGWITEVQKKSIYDANEKGIAPPKTTKLGGGIGIHGWWGEWPDKDQQNLTWGCISLQNVDLDDLYGRVPVGTTILILP
jgi:hypothetical protein